MKRIVVALVAAGFGFGIAHAQSAEQPDAQVNPHSGQIEIADPVWAETNYDIRYVVNPGKTATSFDVTTDPANDLRPRLAIASSGDAWVAWWRDGALPQVFVRRHDHATDTWSAEIDLGEAGIPALNPEVVHDGNRAWIAFEAREEPVTTIRVRAFGEGPDPFGFNAQVASTTNEGELDMQLHARAGRLWVTWTDGDVEIGWSVYDEATQFWSLPEYVDYASEASKVALSQIESSVLGE